MTICAAVKVRDGLILATDSMSTIQGQIEGGQIAVLKNYSNARKLFQIRDMPIGVMSYGLGNIGNRSIQGLMGDFDRSPNRPKAGVMEVAKALFAYFKSAYDAQFSQVPPEQELPGLGFYVAGYSKGNPFPDEWEFLLPRDSEPYLVRPKEVFGASWRGIEIPFTRLYKGYDPRLPQMLSDAGIADEVIQQFLDTVATMESPVMYDGMPVQDAINFAVYILRTTIGMANAEIGPPSCGGPLQLATILPEGNFEWVEKPVLHVESF
jgi:hypothetical protein